MKRLLLVLLLSVAGCVSAQNNSLKLPAQTDTISSGTLLSVAFDPSICSFVLSVSSGNVFLYEKLCTNGIIPPDARVLIASLKPGSVVIFDQVKKRTPDGGTVRLPGKKFVIR